MSKSSIPAGSGSRAKLKQIHGYIKAEDYERAIELSKEVLKDEKGVGTGCYNALILAALSLSKLNPPKPIDAEKAYRQAILLDSDSPLAYHGLGKMLGENGEWDKVMEMEEEGIARGVEKQDPDATAQHLQRLLDLRIKHGVEEKVDRILGVLLPASPIYGLLSGMNAEASSSTGHEQSPSSATSGYSPFPVPDFPSAPTFSELPLGTAIPNSETPPTLPSPLPSISQLVQNQPTSFALLLTLALRAEHRERSSEEKEVEKRRKRLGAGGESAVRRAVGREWLPGSTARRMWEEIEGHPMAEDQVRRAAEGRSFRWWYRLMVCLSRTPSEDDLKLATRDPVLNRSSFPHDLFLPSPPPNHAISKQDARDKVLELSRGMVLLSLPLDEAPYSILLEWSDTGGLAEYDPQLLHDYVEMFPLSATGRMIGGYLRYFGVEDDTAQEEKDKRREERKRRKEEERRAKFKAKKDKLKAKKAARAEAVPPSTADTTDGADEDIDVSQAGPSATSAPAEDDPLAIDEAAQLAAAEAQAEAEIARREPFALLVDTLEFLPKSVFAHKVVGEAYLREEDWGALITTAEKGKDVVRALEIETGAKMPASRAVFDVLLGTALVHYYPPKHHPRALQLLEGVLALDANAIPCLMGKARILQHTKDHESARKVYEHVVHLEADARRDTSYSPGSNELRAREEVGWSYVQEGKIAHGKGLLNVVVESLEQMQAKAQDIARCWWRIGTAEWEEGEPGRDQAHEHWVHCLRSHATYAPAFTSIGIWYLEHADPPEPSRASKCFQKAFELDATETEAAKRLAEGYASSTEWSVVDQIAKRVIAGEGGLGGGHAVKETAGDTQKFLPTNAWAWQAVGAVQMAYKRYTEAAQSFQVALRAEQSNASLWVRLGEAYAKSGRHVAALKALRHGLQLEPENWLCQYHVGNVQRDMGMFEQAIQSYNGIAPEHQGQGILLALSEAHLALATQAHDLGLRQRALQACLRCIETIDQVVSSKAYRLSAWRIFGNACVRLFHCLGGGDAPGTVRDTLKPALRYLASVDETHAADVLGVVDLKTLLETAWAATDILKAGIAAMAYRAHLLKFDTRVPETALYDLAVALYDLGNAFAEDPAKSKDKKACTKGSVLAIKQALEYDPGAAALWNTFGIVAARGSKQLAQHAFVVALGLEPKNASTWCNLGFLFLEVEDLEVANKAFVKAQTLEPENSLAWTGQALVAHAQYQPQRAEALFDQAVTLSAGSDASSALGLAHLAYQPFLDTSDTPPLSLYAPAFALQRYCEDRPTSASPHVLLSLILERLGQREEALKTMRLAVFNLEEQYEHDESAHLVDQYAVATVNLGRLELSHGDLAQASRSCEDCLGLIDGDMNGAGTARRALVRVQCLLISALASTIAGDHDAALGQFQAALAAAETLTGQVRGVYRETIAIYIARTLWDPDSPAGTTLTETRELAKSHLLDSLSEDGKHSARALATTLAVGVLTADEGVIEAVQTEQAEATEAKPQTGAQHAMQEAFALLAMSRGDLAAARDGVLAAIRCDPGAAQRWTDVIGLLGENVETWIVNALTDPAKLASLLQNFKDAGSKAGIRISEDIQQAGEAVEGPAFHPSQTRTAIVLEPWIERHWEALAFARLDKAE